MLPFVKKIPVTVVEPNSYVAEYCLINCGALVAWDSVVNRFVTVGPNVTNSGWCKLEEGCFIGNGASLLQSVSDSRILLTELSKEIAFSRTELEI